MHSLGEEVQLDLNAEWGTEEDDGQMIVDSHEEDWGRLHDVRVTGTVSPESVCVCIHIHTHTFIYLSHIVNIEILEWISSTPPCDGRAAVFVFDSAVDTHKTWIEKDGRGWQLNSPEAGTTNLMPPSHLIILQFDKFGPVLYECWAHKPQSDLPANQQLHMCTS